MQKGGGSCEMAECCSGLGDKTGGETLRVADVNKERRCAG